MLWLFLTLLFRLWTPAAWFGLTVANHPVKEGAMAIFAPALAKTSLSDVQNVLVVRAAFALRSALGLFVWFRVRWHLRQDLVLLSKAECSDVSDHQRRCSREYQKLHAVQ